MTQMEATWTKNSATGRSLPRPPRVVRGAFAALSRSAPWLAARLAEVLFLRPPRRRAPERERVWVGGATRLELRVAGRQLAVWTRGVGPTVLLIHGWGGRGSQLGAFIEPLVSHGFRVAWFDHVGHGASQGGLSSLPEMAQAIGEVGRRIGPLHAIVAHSLGSAAATIAQHAGLSVERCVYLSPPTTILYFTRVFCDILGFTREIEARLQRRIERRFDIRFNDLQGPRLAREMTPPPLLIFHDRTDTDVPFSHGVELATAWPRAKLVLTNGLGHRAILRETAVVDQAVEFVSA